MILLDPDLQAQTQGAAPASRVVSSAASKATPKAAAQTASSALRADRIPTRRTLATFLAQAQPQVRLKGAVNVLLTTDRAIRRLNRDFRGKNKATDVLSFPAEAGFVDAAIAGDLAISVDTARRQARQQGHALSVELKVLMLHGLLHLAGYDHEADSGQMARKERRLRATLKLPPGLIERVEQGAAEPAGKTAPRPAPVGKTAAVKAAGKKAAAKKTPVKKPPATKTAAKQTAAPRRPGR